MRQNDAMINHNFYLNLTLNFTMKNILVQFSYIRVSIDNLEGHYK